MGSLPSRERGLKSHIIQTGDCVVLSLPSRERGLKFYRRPRRPHSNQVAPLAGAWIEIFSDPSSLPILKVAPLAGAWIEIAKSDYTMTDETSLPSRERGLKLEITRIFHMNLCRSPRGSVD